MSLSAGYPCSVPPSPHGHDGGIQDFAKSLTTNDSRNDNDEMRMN